MLWVWPMLWAASAPSVEVAPEVCTSSVAVAAALGHLEAPVEVAVRPAPGGVTLELSAPRTPTAGRELPLGAGDCALLPTLVAHITERFVRALPAHTWTPRAGPVALAPVGRASVSALPPGRRPRFTGAAGADAGATLGAAGQAPGIRARGHADLLRGPLGVVLAGGLTWIPRAPFGDDGHLRIVSPWAGILGVAQGDIGPIPLRAELGLAAGVHVASGQGFEGATTKRQGLLEAKGRVAASGPVGLYGGLGVDVALLRLRAERGQTGAVHLEPRVRLELFLGFARDLVFF